MNAVSKQLLMTEVYRYFKDDPSLCLLVGDMGFAVLDDYLNNHPDRAFNIGIAEQGSMGIAAGMALSGMTPLYYSQIPFLIMRAFEQIRYDICEHQLNVKLIGVGAENFFHRLGRSHCVDEDDLKILSIFPDLLILTPTEESVAGDVAKMFAYQGPVYVRCR
jgi:transketolase